MEWIILKEGIIEPILNNGEPYWLTRKYKQAHALVPDDKPIKEILEEDDGEPLPKEPVFELKKQGLWRCRKCGAKTQSISGKPIECLELNGGCGRNSDFDVITKIINPDLWKIPRWIDIQVTDLDMLNTFNDTVELQKRIIIFPEEIQYKIFTLSLFSSYKIESWDTLGFPAFLGLIDSGKTLGLDIIRELGWRMVHSATATFPAMVRATHFYNAGVLLDEVEHKLNSRTEKGQEMIDFIKPGYRKGSKYLVADKEDQERIISYDNFGYKAFAGEQIWDRALLSRCIVFDMEKDYPEIAKLSRVKKEINTIQTKLINYRYKTTDPPELDENCNLKHGRIRETFEGIIRTGMHIGLEIADIIKYAQEKESEQESDFRNSVQYDILNIIREHNINEKLDDAPTNIKFSDICTGLGWEDKKQKQSLGYILRKMGLKKTHTREGQVILLTEPKNSKKLSYLFKRYEVL